MNKLLTVIFLVIFCTPISAVQVPAWEHDERLERERFAQQEYEKFLRDAPIHQVYQLRGIREALEKRNEDITALREEISALREEIAALRSEISDLRR